MTPEARAALVSALYWLTIGFGFLLSMIAAGVVAFICLLIVEYRQPTRRSRGKK